MAKTRTYQSYTWSNESIDGELVNLIRVSIFKRIDPVVSNRYDQVISTNGSIIQKSNHCSRKYTSDYSFVVLSTGICKNHYNDSYSLKLKVYLTDPDNFDLSLLEKEAFTGKSYVIEAIKLYKETGLLPPLLNQLYERVGDDYLLLSNRLKNFACTYDIDKVEQIFKDYKISPKNQALFWLEMYQETKPKKEMQKSYKFRWKGLLGEHYPYATVNVKVYLKEKSDIFIHSLDLVRTDGQLLDGIVHNFSYVIVCKSIKRLETPGTWHLDIKVYVREFFNPMYLPKISSFWEEYVREVITQFKK